MGSVTGLLGIGGSAADKMYNPVTPEQLQQAQAQQQAAMAQQQGLLTALQGQGGIGNQSNVYNQLQQQYAGQGPNAAQAMLANATGQNVQNQAALMAGQRGAGANAGMIARQAAQQGANTQQQALGQAAALQAQQSQNALGMAGNIAGQQVTNQMGQTNMNQQAAQGAQNALLGAQSNYNQSQAGIAGNQAQQQGQMFGGLLSGAGAAMGVMAHGGQVEPRSSLHQYINKNMGGELKAGGVVPGKAKVAGDSYQNDTVHALLSPGEVVIPKSVMQSGDPANNAAKFVASVLAKKGGKRG